MKNFLFALVLILAFSCGQNEKYQKPIDYDLEMIKIDIYLENFDLRRISTEEKNLVKINDTVFQNQLYFFHPFLEIPVRYTYEYEFGIKNIQGEQFREIINRKIIKKEALVNGVYKESVQENIITIGSDTLDLSESPFG